MATPTPDKTKGLAEQLPLVLLAILVWAEARGEGPRGRAAVAHVVCNRMRQKGQTVAQVALKKWAFSCFNDVKYGGTPPAMLLEPQLHDKASIWTLCVLAAAEALDGISADPTNGATHYCVRDLWACPAAATPKWHDIREIAAGRTRKTAVIGTHVFARANW